MKTSPMRLLAMLLLFLTAFASHAGDVKESRDVEGARETVTSLVNAWNEHDMNAFANLFAEDADYVNIEGTRWRGRSAIKDAHTFVHSTIFKHSHLTVDDTTFKQLSPDVIVARSTWRLEGQTTMKGEPVPSRTGIVTNVMVRSGPKWMIAVTQNTDIVH